LIGLLFVFAASAGILLLAHNPHGGEHLKDMLAGQILWVNWPQLALPAVIYAVILVFWFALRQRFGDGGFYLLFALMVTFSVQLVGVFLVFTSLIAPAIASRSRAGWRGLLLRVWRRGAGLCAGPGRFRLVGSAFRRGDCLRFMRLGRCRVEVAPS
jgi:zinc/manganese transport system permease protein